ncbi:hypothetical protein LguiA_036020 [Lonicera macranthoides]
MRVKQSKGWLPTVPGRAVGLLLAARGLSFLLGRGRWSGILSWGVGLAFRALTLDGEAGPLGSPMLPHAGAGSAVGSSSSDPDLDLRLAPPGGSEPVDPAVYQPLLSDEMRKEELGKRLRINTMWKGYSPQVQDSILSQQLEIEKQIERALLSDGYSRDSILENRNRIRGFILYPTGTALSESTYIKYVDFMQNYGTHRSLPYRRLMGAIYEKDLFLEK